MGQSPKHFVRGSTILLKPLTIPLKASMSSQCCPKLLKHFNVALRVDHEWSLIFILKPVAQWFHILLWQPRLYIYWNVMAIVDNLLDELSPRRCCFLSSPGLSGGNVLHPRTTNHPGNQGSHQTCRRILISLVAKPMTHSRTFLHVSLSKFMLNLYPVRV